MELCEIVGDAFADCGLKCDYHGEQHIQHVCLSPDDIGGLEHLLEHHGDPDYDLNDCYDVVASIVRQAKS